MTATTGTPVVDVACFGYLAAAQVLRVDTYPRANHGTAVRRVLAEVAGDAPLVALALTRAGVTSGLVSNSVGSDPPGRHLTAQLINAGVHTVAVCDTNTATAQLTVVCDNAGTRTWFGWLDPALDHLPVVDTTMLTAARMAYIDCYTIITTAAVRAANVAARAGVPLLLNLGGDPLHPDLAAVVRGRRVVAVQTSLDEPDADHAEALARHLHNELEPDAAVVTLGRLGAVAATTDRVHRATTTAGQLRHTHGAGAAFSAGYITALLAGADLDAALTAGCHAGTRHCTITPPSPRTPTAASFGTRGTRTRATAH